MADSGMSKLDTIKWEPKEESDRTTKDQGRIRELRKATPPSLLRYHTQTNIA